MEIESDGYSNGQYVIGRRFNLVSEVQWKESYGTGCKTIVLNPFRPAVPFWGRTPLILSSLSPKRDCGPKRAINSNSFSTAVPLWGQTTLILRSLYPKRDCSPKWANSFGTALSLRGEKIHGRRVKFWLLYNSVQQHY